jgi:signal transduction histidine kinase/sensor domain CHASE-containing protein
VLTEKEKSKGNIRERVKFPYYVLFFSILLTIGATILFYQSAKGKDDIRFLNNVNRVRFSIENRIGLYIALLKAGRGFIQSSNDLNRQKFKNFADSLELEKNYFGAQGIGYSKTLRRADRENFLAAIRTQGFSNYKIFPESDKEIYQPIVFVEPSNERNQQIIGFDMSSEENRLGAMERARDTAAAAATGKVILLQENDRDLQSGFLIYLPIYQNSEEPPTLEERQNTLQGYIYSPFRAKNFLKDVQDNAGTNDIVIRVYDGSFAAENLLAQTDHPAPQFVAGQISADYSTQNEMEVGGRKWVIEYSSLPSFAAQSSINWTPLIFLCGVIFSLLLFGMTYWEATTRAKLQLTANNLTESERQIQGLLEKEQAARKLAESANATKDEFISVVSHELRTPLNAIAGWTRILKSDDLSGNTKSLALQKIERNLRLQTSLVEDLLNYSQLVSSKESLEKSEIDCSEIFEKVYSEFEKVAQKKGITITKENQLNGQTILGDADKIKIVIVNLFSNALKFTPSAGRINASLGAENKCLEIKIEDTGRGINPEFLPHIFDRFSQYDSSTTRKFGGLGLGLAVSEHIVKLHNGTIEAQSEGEGKGSTFSVKLPVYAP